MEPCFAALDRVNALADAIPGFVYRNAHTPVMGRRRDRFERFDGAYQALWWDEAGHRPGVDEGLARLWRLDRHGPTPQAFTFRARFPVPGLLGPPADRRPHPWYAGRA